MPETGLRTGLVELSHKGQPEPHSASTRCARSAPLRHIRHARHVEGSGRPLLLEHPSREESTRHEGHRGVPIFGQTLSLAPPRLATLARVRCGAASDVRHLGGSAAAPPRKPPSRRENARGVRSTRVRLITPSCPLALIPVGEGVPQPRDSNPSPLVPKLKQSKHSPRCAQPFDLELAGRSGFYFSSASCSGRAGSRPALPTGAFDAPRTEPAPRRSRAPPPTTGTSTSAARAGREHPARQGAIALGESACAPAATARPATAAAPAGCVNAGHGASCSAGQRCASGRMHVRCGFLRRRLLPWHHLRVGHVRERLRERRPSLRRMPFGRRVHGRGVQQLRVRERLL